MESAPFAYYHVRRGLSPQVSHPQPSAQVQIAFLGGSISVGVAADPVDVNSWRSLVGGFFTSTFPDVRFNLVNAGVGGTNSTYGAFRLRDHVLSQGLPDLMFVEFAVNDDDDNEASVRAMEGIVRHVLAVNPKASLCFVYFASAAHVQAYGQGRTPGPIASHEVVAAYYGIASIDICHYIADQVAAGRFRWDDLYVDSVHPNNRGHAVYASIVQNALRTMLVRSDPGSRRGWSNLPALTPSHYGAGQLVGPDRGVTDRGGWNLIESLTISPLTNCRGPLRVMQADTGGQTLTMSFYGTACGAVFLVGPDFGMIEYAIDDGNWVTYDPYDEYVKRFHRPKPVMFGHRLAPGKHTLLIRIARARHPESTGQAVRIVQWMLNE